MNRLISKLIVISILGAVVLLESCSTVDPEMAWQTQAEKKEIPWSVEFYAQENGGQRVHLTGPLMGVGSAMIGEAFPQDDGSWLIHWDRLEWFNNHVNGWTECSFFLWGTVSLHPGADHWTMEVVEEPWLEGIDSGSIRYKDNIVSGQDGQDQMRRRWDRVVALTPALQENLPQPYYPLMDRNRKQKEMPWFRQDMGSYFFPELFGYPPGASPGSETVRAEDIKWDVAYTETVLPEEWQELRNSGTLYRDFEEAGDLFWLSYNWEKMWMEVLPQQRLEQQ